MNVICLENKTTAKQNNKICLTIITFTYHLYYLANKQTKL